MSFDPPDQKEWARCGKGWKLGDRYAEVCWCSEIDQVEFRGQRHIREKVPNVPVWIHYYVDEPTHSILVLRMEDVRNDVDG